MKALIPDTKEPQRFPVRIGHIIGTAGRDVIDGWSMLRTDLRNFLRRSRGARLDYVVIPISGPLPERSGPPRNFIERRLPLPPDPLSIQQLNAMIQAVIEAENARGIVFIINRLSAGLATLQNFRAAIARLQQAGKEAIVYTPYLDLAHYYAATAADAVICPPGARFEVMGLYTEVIFLKDALARLGLSADVVQISPYKTAFDRLNRSEMTPEYREQLDRLLDDQFDMLTGDMADSRGMAQSDFKKLVDTAPFSAEVALASGLIDHVAYDDQMDQWLQRRAEKRYENVAHPLDTPGATGNPDKGVNARPAIELKTWREARKILLQKPRRRRGRYIGVISLEGLINMGTSRKPPIDLPIPLIGGPMAGEQTLVGLLRRIERDSSLAALVFYVNSGGGSALASELIGRQIELLAAKVPVIVYMGDIAASGGYYVSAGARYIMSQRATLTGSIGVIVARLSAQRLYENLSINHTSLKRGERAGLYSDPAPWSEEEHDIINQAVHETYDQFRQVVARGRKMTPEQVDDVGLGRVWTGRQALVNGLVDGHGDMLDAIKKAAELAALPTDDLYGIPVANIFPRSSSYTLPASTMQNWTEGINRLLRGGEMSELSSRSLMLSPYDLRFR